MYILGCKICQHRWKASWVWLAVGISRCEKCYPNKYGESEDSIRIIIERITGWKFPKCRPDFLIGRNGYRLELDGYNKRHAIAFEFQGPDHYKPNWRRKKYEASLGRFEITKAQR